MSRPLSHALKIAARCGCAAPAFAERRSLSQAWLLQEGDSKLLPHYHATERSDSEFWNHCPTMEIADTLAEKLEMFRRGLLKRDHDSLQDASWLAVMLGQGIEPRSYDPLAEWIRPLELDRVLHAMRAALAEAAADLPPHARFLSQHRSPVPA